MLPRWFLILNGMALLLGVALVALRLREAGPRWVVRHGAGFLWALLCIAVGLAQLLMAAGVLDQPGSSRPSRPLRPAVQFPSDR